MHNLLENVGRIYTNSLFLGNLFEFLDVRAQVVDPPARSQSPHPPRRDAL